MEAIPKRPRHRPSEMCIRDSKIIGARDEGAFSQIIDARLADARSRVAKGTPPDKVYDEIMAAAQ